MGAIGREELVKWEKMQGASGREEKILVLVRLRPLSEKEIESNEVADWECINDTTILYRNTLREGSTFPNAYTFDTVFRGDCSTRQVYEEGTREIALSVVSGINSSIFAYGQTSSGKTYTMNGITEYTVAEIFDYIHRHEERAFVVKFSAIEIYNEAVRDLLSTDNTPLRLLDDPDRGTIVEKLTEETLRDWSHLKELLSICEAQRQIGETSLNEKSSRSHQIIRLGIESSAREFLGKDNSTTLAASVSFIDLAGSERASQALSAGARLKEGCHINRSLLTLGTVIRKLSKGRQGHINYRDSKLTRILQPSLGGNARTAIICTLSPARSHVEQTRNTLLFACCAKEVSTKAQVNVVMSDKALVKHLQKELARLESELKTPGPASSACDYVALLRKKDLQIEKMEKQIRELTKQRDLAQSRVQDLLQMIGNGQHSRERNDDHPKLQAEDTWEDEGSVSESSSVVDRSSIGIRRYSNPHYDDRDSENSPDEHQLQDNDNDNDHYLSDGTSSPLTAGKKFVQSNSRHSQDETAEGPDDYCKEVQCIEMEDLSRPKDSDGGNEGALALSGNTDTVGQENSVNRGRELGQMQNGFAYDVLEQRLNDVQMTIDSLATASDMPSSRSFSLTRSWSCRADLLNGSSPDKAHRTPSNGFEKGFPGRPEGLGRRFPLLNFDAKSMRLSRNNSQSSFGSASVDELRAQGGRAGDEDVTSLHTFVTGLKEMAKLEYEKQLVDGQAQETQCKAEKNVKDIGVDPMLETEETPDWPLEFERLQKAILELWQACHVSLVHRTYFFLLFKGDPSDSIYMGVELRRLSFLKETYSCGNQAMEDSRTPTSASSMKALRREREVLGKLMQKRFSEEERKRLFREWGITLDSKRRRLQLANRLWSNPKDMNHVRVSAAIVAKLVRFADQGQALKEMFGLSFTPTITKRRSYGWKNSRISLL
ncbi:Kinesin-related protein 11 [Morus notabilis]|uniref:Kinesin-like protein n=1 Tax=Morus notabilis TaxID=981085 RepID=W9QMV0_9ROSA|nr:kinesin-like protein KIN-7E [Morus notabilis]XP_024017989.1 kinesin-like protein KIN-7E [Morus notabilis]XP_024017990.1 kinesin-like protein KIN-7E [Morus notabilis]XP_024017991.1 kinesin-like protein KIN-7E [Morus notabilis]XP_024017992.1 kinesin-like protein KIN-7E [Morus notabilis]XP_024017993.1 kinesin-like protein KIN-7E [Morus notabilis]XP_024017994.1 kinesin-like protein KIN-7E [Morus notabilis]XP_024017995.1 kinesin-like protein KIN-7E [Morus notabilis]XP_024017996.1 kinesin-like